MSSQPPNSLSVKTADNVLRVVRQPAPEEMFVRAHAGGEHVAKKAARRVWREWSPGEGAATEGQQARHFRTDTGRSCMSAALAGAR